MKIIGEVMNGSLQCCHPCGNKLDSVKEEGIRIKFPAVATGITQCQQQFKKTSQNQTQPNKKPFHPQKENQSKKNSKNWFWEASGKHLLNRFTGKKNKNFGRVHEKHHLCMFSSSLPCLLILKGELTLFKSKAYFRTLYFTLNKTARYLKPP